MDAAAREDLTRRDMHEPIDEKRNIICGDIPNMGALDLNIQARCVKVPTPKKLAGRRPPTTITNSHRVQGEIELALLRRNEIERL